MLASAMLPEGKTLREIMGPARYARAASWRARSGVDLSMFDQFAPWFVAEAISQLQLTQLGFDPSRASRCIFLERARTDGKSVAGLETAHEQIALFEGMSMDSAGRVPGLEPRAGSRPAEAGGRHGARLAARRHALGSRSEIKSDIGRDPALYQSLLVARNRKWIARIESAARR